MESVRSNSDNFREDNLRNTKGLSLLERANRAFERESENSNNSAPMCENQPPEKQYDVIEEVMSESLNHSVVQNAVMSSDHSLAPPGEELEEEHELVWEGNLSNNIKIAVSSKSDEESENQHEREKTKTKERNQDKNLRSRKDSSKNPIKHSKDTFKGKTKFEKRPQRKAKNNKN